MPGNENSEVNNETVKGPLSRDEKLNILKKTHSTDKVYPKGMCGNDEITFDAYAPVTIGEGDNKTTVIKKIPVTTVKSNRMESHFTFDKPKSEE